MKIDITPAALKWFKDEFVIEEGRGIKFFGKVYGNTQVHEGFSVGLEVASPEDPIWQKKIEGILFFAEAADEWFFANYDMTVDFDLSKEEPRYEFTERS